MLKEKEINIVFLRHKSAKNIIYEWFVFKKNIPLNTKVSLDKFTEKNEIGYVSIAIDQIKKKGYWGFYKRGKPSEIHFWINKNCNTLEIMELLSHEIAHASGYKSENSAIKIATIAAFALYVLHIHCRDRVKIKGVHNALYKKRGPRAV